jgi:hypothetical protein
MLASIDSTTFSLAIGAQKLGQPVPDSNFVSELNRAVSQQIQRNTPLSCTLRFAPVKGRSVPACRVTSNEAGNNCCFHSFSLFWMTGTRSIPFAFSRVGEIHDLYLLRALRRSFDGDGPTLLMTPQGKRGYGGARRAQKPSPSEGAMLASILFIGLQHRASSLHH